MQENKEEKQMRKKALIILGGMLIMSLVTGCSVFQERKSTQEIADYFIPLREHYPTYSLLEFCDKSDSGTYRIDSNINYEKDGALYAEGITVNIDCATKEITGVYRVMTIGEEKTSVEYALYYDEEGYHLIDEVEDEELKERILNYKFLIEYINLGNEYIDELEVKEASYNPNIELYWINYYLSVGDINLDAIYKENPKLPYSEDILLKFEGKGDSSDGSKDLEIKFNDEANTYINESITYHR